MLPHKRLNVVYKLSALCHYAILEYFISNMYNLCFYVDEHNINI